MFESQKNAFWTALILTVFVFAFGIFMGFLLENSRTSEIEKMYTQTELNLLDARVQNDVFSLVDFDCKSAVDTNIEFANRVYDEARLLEEYETANKISDSLQLEHKKYDLMRTLLWANSIRIKSKCNESFHTVVYLYDYNNPGIDKKAKQAVFSRLLGETKQDMGNEIMLIPIAGDNGIVSLKILMNSYGISEQDLPVILVDEKIKIFKLESKSEIESVIGSSAIKLN